MRYVLSWVLLVIFGCAPAETQPYHGAWNGMLVQTVPGGPTNGNDYPFINYLKTAGDWNTRTGNHPRSPRYINRYGYPINNAEVVADGGWRISIQTPNVMEYPGDIIVKVHGYCATCGLTNKPGIRLISVSKGCTNSSTFFTGGDCRAVYSTTNETLNPLFEIGGVDGNREITSIQIYNVNDEAALNAGEIFGPQFKRIVCSNFGVLRYLNKNNANVTNVATWEDNTPIGWWSYGAPWYPASITTDNPIVLQSGAEYTLDLPGFTLAAGAHAIAAPASAIVPPGYVVIGVSGSVITFSAAPTAVVRGMFIGDSRNSSALQPNATVSSVNTAANQVTLSCASPCTNPIWAGVKAGDTLYFSPMLNINNTGYVPVLTSTAQAYGTSGDASIIFAQLTVFTYDAQFGAYLVNLNNRAVPSGLSGMWPPQVMVRLANECRAHPWFIIPPFSDDPQTDYLPSLLSFLRDNLDPDLIPRIEITPNESWNPSFYPYQLGRNKEYVRSGVDNDEQDWNGMIVSQGCQTISAFYGGDRTKYECVVGMCPACQYGIPAGPNDPGPNGNGQDNKLYSPLWVKENCPRTQICRAAHWATQIASNGYWQSGCNNPGLRSQLTPWEIAWAYQYSLTPSQAKKNALITDYLNCNSSQLGANYSLGYMGNNYAKWARYLAAYRISLGLNIGQTQYEGGYNASNSTQQLISVIGVKTGRPTVLIIQPSWTGHISQSGGISTLHVTIPPTKGSITNTTPVLCSACAAQTYVVNLSRSCTDRCELSTAQTVGSLASPVSMTGENAWDIICNTADLCTASGPSYTGNPRTKITGACTELSGKDYAVISATPTTVTIDASTDSGCIFAPGGTAAYDDASAYVPAFELAVQLSPLLAPYELKNLENFYSVSGAFPSEFETTGQDQWAIFYPDAYSANTPKVTAAHEFQRSP